MALITCPECGQSISDKALKCPKCGYPLQKNLSDNKEKMQEEQSDDTLINTKQPINLEQTPTKKKSKKKVIVALLVVCVAVTVVVGIILTSNIFASKIIVENITISKWRLTDSTKYGDDYEGTVTSEQKKPFVAVIGQYENEEDVPQFVYVEDGKGIIETYEDTDEDPSIKYRPIGYLNGVSVDIADMKVTYKDSDYYDWEYSDKTSCDVLINVNMSNSKNGLLIFDVINETNNETERNVMATVINGKIKYSYYANLPYKARGIDISIVPKMFCESTAIKQKDYAIEKAYTAEKSESSYSNSYSGEMTLTFADHTDGLVLYTEELKDGGNKEDRNIVNNLYTFLHDGECVLKTYDSVDEDESILMPKYEFDMIGYITWTLLEKETI